MAYSNDVIEQVRSSNDIVSVISSYIPLKQKGSSYFGLCPFHNEKSPSFSVNPHLQLYHCFGCGASGNVFTFIMQIENYNFVEAVKFLAERVNITLPKSGENDAEANKKLAIRNKLLKINVEAARYFYHNLRQHHEALRYLFDRNISKDSIKKFGLGYATKGLCGHLMKLGYTENEIFDCGLGAKGKFGDTKIVDRFVDRIMFPIFDIYGKIVGFGGRKFGQTIKSGDDRRPKYLNSPETVLFNKSSNLYNINLACKSREKTLILVEGYMDVISVYQAGCENVCAALGTAFGIKHARLIKNHFDSVILLFDSDQAGVQATLRAIPILESVGLETKVAQVEEAKDPDEYIKIFGNDMFKKLLARAVDSVRFKIDNAKKHYDIAKPADKVKFTKEVAQIISAMDDKIRKEVYINELSKTSEVSVDTLRNQIDSKSDDVFKESNLKVKEFSRQKRNDALDKAQRELINVLVERFMKDFPQALDLCKQVKEYLSPTDLDNKICAKLLEIVYSFDDRDCVLQQNIHAKLINYFDVPDEQSIVAEIFIQEVVYDDLSKALTDIVKFIKEKSLERNIDNMDDVEQLRSFVAAKKAVENIHIDF